MSSLPTAEHWFNSYQWRHLFFPFILFFRIGSIPTTGILFFPPILFVVPVFFGRKAEVRKFRLEAVTCGICAETHGLCTSREGSGGGGGYDQAFRPRMVHKLGANNVKNSPPLKPVHLRRYLHQHRSRVRSASLMPSLPALWYLR